MIIENILPPAPTSDLGISAVNEEDFEISADGTVSVAVPPLIFVSQSTGTDDEIETMLNEYYNGKSSLEDVQSVQAVGDIRQANETDHAMMKIAAHSSFSNDSTTSIVEQSTIKQVIIDFNHDDLTTAIGSISKALITIQMYGTLGSSASVSASSKMNTSASNTANQTGIPRRIQCNGNFYNALCFKSQVKQVHKPCCSYSSSTIFYTDDYCFLPSHTEVFTYSSTYTKAAEGNQYNYFTISTNKIKKQGWEGTGSTSTGNMGYWQLRSPRTGASILFCCVKPDGDNYQYNANANISISICIAI